MSRVARALEVVVPSQGALREPQQRRKEVGTAEVVSTPGDECGLGLEEHGPAGGEGDEQEEQQH